MAKPKKRFSTSLPVKYWVADSYCLPLSRDDPRWPTRSSFAYDNPRHTHRCLSTISLAREPASGRGGCHLAPLVRRIGMVGLGLRETSREQSVCGISISTPSSVPRSSTLGFLFLSRTAIRPYTPCEPTGTLTTGRREAVMMFSPRADLAAMLALGVFVATGGDAANDAAGVHD